MTTEATSNGANRKARRAAKAKARQQEPAVEATNEPAQPQPQPQRDITAMHFDVGGALIQATLNYLASRPYQEVFKLIAAWQGVQSIDD